MSLAVAWVAGGSGLVGGVLLRRLLADGRVGRVVSTGRRLLPTEDARLAQALVRYDDPASFEGLEAPTAALCCLGTTLARAGSRAAFRAGDLDAVVGFARAARRGGATVLVHVTALGADPRSRVFYNAVKGEAEQAMARLGFESVYALRPSLLDGDRAEARPAERVALAAGRLLAPLLGRYRPTAVSDVAGAMVAAALAAEPGVHVVEGRAIGALAASLTRPTEPARPAERGSPPAPRG